MDGLIGLLRPFDAIFIACPGDLGPQKPSDGGSTYYLSGSGNDEKVNKNQVNPVNSQILGGPRTEWPETLHTLESERVAAAQKLSTYRSGLCGMENAIGP